MTATEKAQELLNKMLSKNPNRQDGISIIDTIQAKLCALVAVDEILNTNTLQDRSCGFIPLCEKHTKYWQEVKKELQNV
jgi:hypothetical protein